jgi:hypothetical protein
MTKSHLNECSFCGDVHSKAQLLLFLTKAVVVFLIRSLTDQQFFFVLNCQLNGRTLIFKFKSGNNVLKYRKQNPQTDKSEKIIVTDERKL